MTRDREHRGDGSHEREEAGAASSPSQSQPQDARLTERRRQQRAGEVRRELRAHAQRAAKAVLLGGNLFQMMVRGDGEAALHKQLAPDLAGKITDKVLDKVVGKLRDGLVAVADLGEGVASRALAVFGAVKGAVDKRVQLEGQLTVLELADHVSAALVDRAAELEAQLGEAVDALPVDRLLAIGQFVDDQALGGALRARDDGGDSPERGRLSDGMRDQAMQVLGLPAGDTVAAEEVALVAYGAFQSEVRGAGTAAEQVDAVQHRLSHPHEDADKLGAAEAKMGRGFQRDLERDRTLRARVAQSGGSR